MLKTLSKFANSWLGFVLLLCAIYFGVRGLQTYWGRQALAAVNLPYYSLQAAQQLAQQRRQLILAELSAIWCSNCRALDLQIFNNPHIQQLLTEQYVYARIDERSDEAEIFAQRYGAEGYPTLVLLDAQGNLIKRLGFTLDPQQFAQQLQL